MGSYEELEGVMGSYEELDNKVKVIALYKRNETNH